MWLSQRMLTSKRPVTFLTVQKSAAARVTTMMKVRISSWIIAFKKRKQNTVSPLNARWNKHATGLSAVEKSVSTKPSSCRCLKCSDESDWALGVLFQLLNSSPRRNK